jgi:hypothetical protein
MQGLELAKEIATKNGLEIEEDKEKYIIPYFYDDVNFEYNCELFNVSDIVSYDGFIYIYKDSDKNYGEVYFNFNLPKYNIDVKDVTFIASLRELDFAIKEYTNTSELKDKIKNQLIYVIKTYFIFYENYQYLKRLQSNKKIYIRDVKKYADKLNGVFLMPLPFEASFRLHRMSIAYNVDREITGDFLIVMGELDKIYKEYGMDAFRY